MNIETVDLSPVAINYLIANLSFSISSKHEPPLMWGMIKDTSLLGFWLPSDTKKDMPLGFIEIKNDFPSLKASLIDKLRCRRDGIDEFNALHPKGTFALSNVISEFADKMNLRIDYKEKTVSSIDQLGNSVVQTLTKTHKLNELISNAVVFYYYGAVVEIPDEIMALIDPK